MHCQKSHARPRLLDQHYPTATPVRPVRIAAPIGPDDNLHSRRDSSPLFLKPALMTPCFADHRLALFFAEFPRSGSQRPHQLMATRVCLFAGMSPGLTPVRNQGNA
jgi:hypothetical protein